MLGRMRLQPLLQSSLISCRMASMDGGGRTMNGALNGSSQGWGGVSLMELPKSATFTAKLPPDPEFPTPLSSHQSPRSRLGPRRVKGALYTFVRPDAQQDPDLLAVSPAALRDLGIREGEERTELFRDVVAGNRLLGWDEQDGKGELYPWAQCYGGWQFGSWADQLGDGRAISLFEVTNPSSRVRYELQLKGAGRTPYSRFADGQAVLRSSIREFLVSEYLNALGIPTTRALSLTLLPHRRVLRERTEPGAIVARFAQSWLRIGTFDLLGARRERALIRRLADYVAEDVFGGWDTLPARISKESPQETNSPRRGVPAPEVEGSGDEEENRYARLFREIVRRNAATVAAWQAYGFINGVCNTDNTSLLGLSLDFGPFAFMDNFDPGYTPNHDDYGLRYSYGNQPTVIWWNLLRLGETLGELIGAAGQVDEAGFEQRKASEPLSADVVKRAEAVIKRVGTEYKSVFLAEYRRLMTARLGLRSDGERRPNFDERHELFGNVLELMENLELDLNHFFRRLGHVSLADIDDPEARKTVAERFLHREGVAGMAVSKEVAKERIADWLGSWRKQVLDSQGDDSDEARQSRMKAVNPKFIPRNWVLDEVIQRVEQQHDRTILPRVLHMALHPFDDSWDFPAESLTSSCSAQGQSQAQAPFGGEEEMMMKKNDGGNLENGDEDPVKAATMEAERFCGDVPKPKRGMQCSCSS